MNTLTTVDELILNALSNTEWRNRIQIAHTLATDYTLNQHDIVRLEGLVRNGYVERRSTPISKARTVYEYRKVQS